MKNILVPTDFSDYANYAAEIACSIARKSGGRIYLMHVVDIPTYVDTHGASFGDIPEGIAALRYTKQQFKELLKKDFFNNVNVGEVLQFNDVFTNISAFANENEIDLIVMGSHGSSGFKEIFIGSNTQKIVRTAKCPVLTVKDRIENFDIKNLVFASEFNEDTFEAYNSIVKIADYFNANIDLVKVITKDNFESQKTSNELIEKFVDEFGLTKYTATIYNSDSVENGINEFASDRKADVIAVTTHGRSTFSQMFQDSMAEKLVNHSELPVLSVKIS